MSALGPASIEVSLFVPRRGDPDVTDDTHAEITVQGVVWKLDGTDHSEADLLRGGAQAAGYLARLAVLLTEELDAQALEHGCAQGAGRGNHHHSEGDRRVLDHRCRWVAFGTLMDSGEGWTPGLWLSVPRNRTRHWLARVAEVLDHLERTDQIEHYGMQQAEPPGGASLRLVSGT